jgi:serine/threonine-protein kinase
LVTTQRDRARQIVVQALDPAGRRVAVGNGTDARYVDTGYLVFGDGGTLLAAPFDLDSLHTSGTPFAVAEGVLRQAVIQSVDFAVSANGALVYRTIAQPHRALVWVSRDGDQEPIRAPARAYDYARVSPDGTKIAVSLIDEGREIFVWDLTDRTFTRLTFNRDVDMLPVWMPDSRRIVFGSSSGGRRNISRQSVDGTGTPEVLLDRGTDIVLQPNSIAPDGKRLIFRHGAFVGAAGAQDNNLWSLPLEGDAEAMPLLATEHHELNGEISPDGRWLAYQSNETGPFEIYIRPYPDVNRGHWQVSTGGGIQPAWSPDGSELFYASGGRLMSVPVRAGATPAIGAARALIDALPYAPYERSGRAYDVAPDGQRFLFVITAAAISDHPFEGSDRYEVVLNWTEELKRALPAGAP